jgi:HTH-type transcriptional regulator/antitoxin HigA
MLEKAIEHWDYIAPLVAYPKNDKEFVKLVSHLDELLKIVGDDEKHHLAELVDIISNLISSYEKEHYQKPTGKGIDALKFLMDSHHLHQFDLPEIASQGVLSEILNGKRSLNLRQIKLLSERFNVNPSTFIDD